MDAQIGRLTTVLAGEAAGLQSVVDAIRQREEERRDVRARLEHVEGLAQQADDFDIPEWLEETRELLDNLYETMMRAPVTAGRMLRALLNHEPVVVTPTTEATSSPASPFCGSICFEAIPAIPGVDIVIGPMKGEKHTQTVTGSVPARVWQWCPRPGTLAHHTRNLQKSLTLPLIATAGRPGS